jgi:ABC-type glycerol-3-phosphate transport system substrate-binding protein
MRTLGIGAGLTLIAPIVAACGQSGGTAPAKPAESKPAETKPAAPAAAPAATTAPAAPAAPAAAGGTPQQSATAAIPVITSGTGKEVVVWSGQITFNDMNTSNGRWATYIRDQFVAKNPGFSIKVEDHGWDQALRTALLTAIAGGTVPDVTTGEAFVHEFAALGALAPIPDLSVKDFAHGPIAGAYYKEKIYGVPIYTSAFALETNVRVAKKAGIDPNTPPKTWDELLANAEKATKAGAGSYVGYNLYGPAPNRVYGTVLRTLPWIIQSGKSLGDDDGVTPSFNAPEQVAAYEFSRKLFKNADPGNSFSGDEAKLYSYLWDDKALYQISHMSLVLNAKDAKAETVYHPLPVQKAGVTGNVVLGNITFSPLAKAKNPEGAQALVKFMADKETQRQLGEINGVRLPTVMSLLTDPQLEQATAYKNTGSNIARTYADILLKEDVHPVPPFAKNADKIWIAWGDAFGKILQGNDDIKPILDELQQSAERLLK